MGSVRIKRVYESAEAADGTRVLVDRLWPRGVTRERAAVDEWLREVAPSHELRRWYGHVAEREAEFRDRYRRELAGGAQAAALERLVGLLGGREPVTLLTATSDVGRSHAQVLALVLADISRSAERPAGDR